MARHIYVESMRTTGLPPHIAGIGVMVVTAVLHEFVLSFAFKLFRPWFFCIILLQVPYMYLSNFFKGTRLGNLVMWIGLFAGMPLLYIFYGREVALRGGVSHAHASSASSMDMLFSALL